MAEGLGDMPVFNLILQVANGIKMKMLLYSRLLTNKTFKFYNLNHLRHSIQIQVVLFLFLVMDMSLLFVMTAIKTTTVIAILGLLIKHQKV